MQFLSPFQPRYMNMPFVRVLMISAQSVVSPCVSHMVHSTDIAVEVALTSRKVVVLFAPTEATTVSIPPSTVAVVRKKERKRKIL